jgi:hypothetical protein
MEPDRRHCYSERETASFSATAGSAALGEQKRIRRKTTMKTIVAMYNSVENAKRTISALADAGVRANDMNLIAGEAGELQARQLAPTGSESDKAAEGATAGGVLGGLVGVLVGVGAFAVPGLGPIIAAGPLAAGLIGAAAGAAGGGLIGALVDWGVGEEEASFYLEGVRRGGALVAVRVPDEQAELVAKVMDQPGLVDIQSEAKSWRESGWEGYGGEFDDVDFDTVNSTFRDHFDTTYGATAGNYNTFVPAYRFGYFAASDPRFTERPWAEVEPEVAAAWEAEYGEDDWERYRDALRYSFETALSQRI